MVSPLIMVLCKPDDHAAPVPHHARESLHCSRRSDTDFLTANQQWPMPIRSTFAVNSSLRSLKGVNANIQLFLIVSYRIIRPDGPRRLEPDSDRQAQKQKKKMAAFGRKSYTIEIFPLTRLGSASAIYHVPVCGTVSSCYKS